MIPRRSPFGSYFPTVENAPRPQPNRFALRRLGLSEADLAAQTARKADEFLREANEVLCEAFVERRLARLFPSKLSSTLRILTKKDCMQLFRTTGVPTTGSLMGVYRWAANLGESRYNFEEPADVHDYSFLDPYV